MDVHKRTIDRKRTDHTHEAPPPHTHMTHIFPPPHTHLLHAHCVAHHVQVRVRERGEDRDGLEHARAHLPGEHVADGAEEGGEVVLLEVQHLG